MATITRCGTISLLGRPNVGKSSIMNTIIGEKVAIVSPKPQTTRNRIIGVLTEDSSQFVFMDTPGLHRSESVLGDKMNRTVYETAEDVDAALLVIEPKGEARIGKPEQKLLARIQKLELPTVLVINKIDTVEKAELLPWMDVYARAYNFTDILLVSAKTGDGIEDITKALEPLLPTLSGEEAPLFPEDALTDQPEKVLAQEFVRERLLWHLEKEIPHGIATLTESFEEEEDLLSISVVIVCDKENHKGIIIGSHGEMLKQVGKEARMEMEKLFGTRVFLTLFVRVKNDWRNSEYMLNEFGY